MTLMQKGYIRNNANKVGLKGHMAKFKGAYLSEDHIHISVDDIRVKFKTGFVEAVERFIPSKMAIPWIRSSMQRSSG